MKWLFEDNPTPTQIKNRIIFNAWVKRQKKTWLNVPFLGIFLITALVWVLFFMGVFI